MRIATIVILAALAACSRFGHVNQGQVVEYQPREGIITLVADSNYRDPAHPRFDVLPPVTIRTPADPQEMGQAPQPGKLLAFDAARRAMVIFDAATRSLRMVPCTIVSEQDHVSPSDPRVRKAKFPLRDRAKGTITAYFAADQKLVEFTVAEPLRNLADDTWKVGDEIRYYYKDPARALRLMNVTKAELSEGGK